MGIVLERFDFNRKYVGQNKFDCSSKTINDFVASKLKQQVKKNLSLACVLLDDDCEGRLAGFYTLTAFCIEGPSLGPLALGSLPSRVPCTRLVMLGVDRAYQGKGLGKKLLLHVIDRTIACSSELGIFGVYLDADAAALQFYLDYGFVALKEPLPDSATPMFLHIETAKPKP